MQQLRPVSDAIYLSDFLDTSGTVTYADGVNGRILRNGTSKYGFRFFISRGRRFSYEIKYRCTPVPLVLPPVLPGVSTLPCTTGSTGGGGVKGEFGGKCSGKYESKYEGSMEKVQERIPECIMVGNRLMTAKSSISRKTQRCYVTSPVVVSLGY